MRVYAALALFAACSSPTPTTDVTHVTGFDVSRPLRELAANPPRFLKDDEAEPVLRIPHPRMVSGVGDLALQTRMGAAPAAAVAANFEGMGAGMTNFTPGGVPPDTDGAIGPNHYVQVVNTSLAVFDRTGNVMMGPVDTGTLWMGFAGDCGMTNDGDATVRYDHLADRWVVAQFSISGSGYFQCVAVSTSGDPTGTYTRYQFNYDAMNDYPKVSLWPNAYVFTFNMFPNNGFAGGKVCAMDRTAMLAGMMNPSMQCFDAGQNYGGLLASDLDGRTLPPPDAPIYVATIDSNTTLAYWQLKVDFTTPANSAFTGPTAIMVSSYDPLCGGNTCVDEPTGGLQLDSLADRPMNRFVYRRFADHESLLLSHSVTAGTGGGVRWYELRTPAMPTVFQQGTYAPDSAFRWMPSMAMDGAGDIAAIYTVSSTTVFPSIRYASRTPTDEPGTLGATEGTIVTGASVQTQLSRWGDYSSLNIDPVDDCTFWGTHEYRMESGRRNWRTRVASFQLPNCSSFLVARPDAETVAQAGTVTYPIATTVSAGSPQMVTLSATGLPTGVTATFQPPTIMSGDSAMVTLTADPSATVGMSTYTIVAAGSTSSMVQDVALTVQEGAATPDGGTDGVAKAGGGCCDTGGAPGGSGVLALGVIVALRRRRR
jgi:hypothetical protein